MSGRRKRGAEFPYRRSDFVGSCGIIIPLPRMYRQREKGHQKTLWCPRCESYHNFTEIRDMEAVRTLSGELIEELFAPVEINMPAAKVQKNAKTGRTCRKSDTAQDKKLDSISRLRNKLRSENRRRIQIVIHADRMTKLYSGAEAAATRR